MAETSTLRSERTHPGVFWLPDQLIRGGGTRSLKALGVYIALSCHSDSKGGSFPGVPLLARELNISENSIRDGFKELVTLNWLRIEPRHREDGSQASNVYTLLDPFKIQGGPVQDLNRGGSNCAGGAGSDSEPLEGSPSSEGTPIEGIDRKRALSAPTPPKKLSPRERIKFDTQTEELLGIEASDLARWKEINPAVAGDQARHLAKAKDWLLNHPGKYTDISSFLTNWFTRAEPLNGNSHGHRPEVKKTPPKKEYYHNPIWQNMGFTDRTMTKRVGEP